MAFLLENLQACQKAVDFADHASALTESFPRVYCFLADQLTRAVLRRCRQSALARRGVSLDCQDGLMRRSLLALVIVFAFAGTSRQATASGFPGYLDEFCRTAKYIAVAECEGRAETAARLGAKLKVEMLFKAPEEDPAPAFLEVSGISSTATRFEFEKGKRYFVFVFKDGHCDSQGSHIEITRDGRLAGSAHELICLEEGTDTLDKLTDQVKRVVSGEYEKELIARIGNKELSNDERCGDALALCRTNPESAGEVLEGLLLEMSRQRKANGSGRDAYMKLLALDANRARNLSLQVLSNTDSFELYFEAAEVLSRPQCKLDDLERHYATLVKAAEEWERINPNSGYAQMLPVFVNNGCRTPDVKRMLLAALSSPTVHYFDLICDSAISLEFRDAMPAFWNLIKKERQVSDLVNLDIRIAQRVGASTIYGNENFERLEVWMGKDLIRRDFPQYRVALVGADVVRVNKSLLFLIRLADRERLTCLYVGYVREARGRFRHKVFTLFGEM